MDFSEIKIIKALRHRGHVAVILKLSLPSLSEDSELKGEGAERFSSFYRTLSESYLSAAHSMLGTLPEDFPGGRPIFPVRIEVDYEIKERTSRKRRLLDIERKTVIIHQGAPNREIVHHDLFDIDYGVFVK